MCKINFSYNRIEEVVGNEELTDKFFGKKSIELDGWKVEVADHKIVAKSSGIEEDGFYYETVFILNTRFSQSNLIRKRFAEVIEQPWGDIEPNPETEEILDRRYKKVEWKGSGEIWLSGGPVSQRTVRPRSKEFLDELDTFSWYLGEPVEGVRHHKELATLLSDEDFSVREVGEDYCFLTDKEGANWLYVEKGQYKKVANYFTDMCSYRYA